MFDFLRKRKENPTFPEYLSTTVKDECEKYLGRYSEDLHQDIAKVVLSLQSTQKRLDALEGLLKDLSWRNTDAIMLKYKYEELLAALKEKGITHDLLNSNNSSAKPRKKPAKTVSKSVRRTKSNTKAKR